MDKECGDCTVCCSVLEIEELNKPARVDCSNLCGKGCSIYSTRPPVCRSFKCVWKVSNWPDKFRPDRCGFMVYGDNEAKLRIVEFEDNAVTSNKAFLGGVFRAFKKLKNITQESI